MTFEEWISELRRLHVEEFGIAADVYGEDSSWRSYFTAGYAPKLAIQEDLNNGEV